MKRFVTLLLTVWSCSWAAPCWGQPALDQLEKDVRGLVDQNAKPAQAGGNDAVNQAPAADQRGDANHKAAQGEPGYLGVIADDREERGAGVRILDLLPGGPAEQAGLKAGDLVIGIDDQVIRSMEDFGRRMTGAAPGAKLKFNIQRDARTQSIDVTLGRRPPPDQRPLGSFGRIPEPPPAAAPQPAARALLGLRVVPVTDDARLALGLPQTRGALVVEVASGSVAQKSNVPVQAVIVSVNAQRVDTPDDLLRLVAEAGPGATIKLAYYSQGKLFERKITLDTADGPRGERIPAGGGRPVAVAAERPLDDTARVEALERRVHELEQRIAELERLLRAGGAKKPPAADLPVPDPSLR
jgi:S1-C subfamily serine protease